MQVPHSKLVPGSKISPAHLTADTNLWFPDLVSLRLGRETGKTAESSTSVPKSEASQPNPWL